MDIDIDSADRERILKLIKHTPASIHRSTGNVKHNTGVYVNPIPKDPESGLCTLDHKTAEDMGYIKLDFLNVGVYERIQDDAHLDILLNTDPDWSKLHNRSFVERIIHINNHYDTMQKMPEPVDSIARMAMLLSVIRPAKRHLIGLPWKTVAESVWQKPTDSSYFFKHAHAVGYATLVAVNINLDCGV
jgi:hypothetical protein